LQCLFTISDLQYPILQYLIELWQTSFATQSEIRLAKEKRFFPFPSRLSLFLLVADYSIKVSGVSLSLFKTSSLIKGFSPYFDFFGRDKVGYFGLDRSTWKERRIDTARPPIYQKKGKGGGVCLNNRNNREFGNEKRKRESRGILPSGQRAAVYPTLVDLSSYRLSVIGFSTDNR
jgi:hypothetical protein